MYTETILITCHTCQWSVSGIWASLLKTSLELLKCSLMQGWKLTLARPPVAS